MFYSIEEKLKFAIEVLSGTTGSEILSVSGTISSAKLGYSSTSESPEKTITNFVRSHYTFHGITLEGVVVDPATPDFDEKRALREHVLKLLNIFPIGTESIGKAKHIARGGNATHLDKQTAHVSPKK